MTIYIFTPSKIFTDEPESCGLGQFHILSDRDCLCALGYSVLAHPAHSANRGFVRSKNTLDNSLRVSQRRILLCYLAAFDYHFTHQRAFGFCASLSPLASSEIFAFHSDAFTTPLATKIPSAPSSTERLASAPSTIPAPQRSLV